MQEQYKKSGYLTGDLKIFYLKENTQASFDFHYHDFHKLLIFLGGSISYAVEGREYDLCPGDLVLIRAGEIHRPVIHDHLSYKRMIIYISDKFFHDMEGENCDLFHCYRKSEELHSNVIRFSASMQTRLQSIVSDVALSFKQPSCSTP